MDRKRVWRWIRINTFINKGKKVRYIRKKKIFAHFGEKSSYAPRKIPLYSDLISIGDNVRIAADVTFIPHDMIHAMLNNHTSGKYSGNREYIGCIKIENNVFVGSETVILADVHIGSNVIIGAGTLVNKDLEDGYVYAGVPARKICTFEEFVEKRRKAVNYPEEFSRSGDSVGSEFSKWMWADFEKRHPQG